MRTYGKLRELVKAKFDTLGDFADALGISRSTLSQKINGLVGWKQDEIEKACDIVGIDIDQVGEYFFY